MVALHEGQCGLCVHFGEDHQDNEKLMHIRTTHQVSEDMVDDCGLPHNSEVHLHVAAISGCDKFAPASAG